jgi:hypothetical protein
VLEHDGVFRRQFVAGFQGAQQDAGSGHRPGRGPGCGASTHRGSTFNGHRCGSTGLGWAELNIPFGGEAVLIEKAINLYDNKPQRVL